VVIDLYCERTTPDLWAEPLNAASNVLFVVAAAVCARRARQRGQTDALALALVLGTIGIGSGLFHVFATRWALWFDVVPIAVFQLGYLVCYLRRAAHLHAFTVAVALAAFIGALAFGSTIPDRLNGSLAYLPALLVLGGLGADHWRRTGSRLLLVAAGLFVVSLGLRTIDSALCPVWPWGTHWAWHTLNAIVLACALEAYQRSRTVTRAAPQG